MMGISAAARLVTKQSSFHLNNFQTNMLMVSLMVAVSELAMN